MFHRVEVAIKPEFFDALGESTKKSIIINCNLKIKELSVRTISTYTIEAAEGRLSQQELKRIAEKIFADHITESYSINNPLAQNFNWMIEVAFRPGVTDNVGKTAKEAIKDLLKKEVEAVYTSKQYLIFGYLTYEDCKKIASELLANELIENYEIISYERLGEKKLYVPKVKLENKPNIETINLDVSDQELMKIVSDRVLAATLDEIKIFRDYFKKTSVIKQRKRLGLRGPTDVELESFFQTQSEHCKHKIFNALIDYKEKGQKHKLVKKEIINSLFDTYIRASTEKIRAELRKKGKYNDFCISVFSDNAGVFRFNADWYLVMKVETHNSPSALDPYGGALTGIVGVNRDPMGTGKGGKLLFNTDVFCFGDPYYKDQLPPRILHPRRIFEGVRKGVEHGGNKSGIPTVNGTLRFDNKYLGKPLVYCGTGAIMPAKILGEDSSVKRVRPGDFIVMTGGRIGKDGIHGATFSSEELHMGSPSTAVQIGDPITQKKMSDFLLEARDNGWYDCITDNGAGGLSSSVGEMAKHCGCIINLEKCPLKYQGLNPWEILLSEAQERMSLAVSPMHIKKFLELAERRDVEATVIGMFTNTKKFHIMYNDKTVAYLDMNFLHNGLPQMKLSAEWKEQDIKGQDFKEQNVKVSEPIGNILLNMLSRLNICSKEYVVRQYDHEVKGHTVLKPLTGIKNDGPSDAAVLKPVYDSNEGIIISNGINPNYGYIDTYHMTACAIDEAIRNIIACGGSLKQIVLLDNFSWPDPVESKKTPDGKFKLAQLVRTNKALYDYTTKFMTPLVSGKDSMKNEYYDKESGIKISVPPTLLITAIGKISDIRKAVTMDAKNPGNLIYIVGKTHDELGGSEFYFMQNIIGKNVPKVDAKNAIKIFNSLSSAMENELVASCHDISDGGLGVALAEMSFSGGLGMSVYLKKVSTSIKKSGKESKSAKELKILFAESQTRFIVEVEEKNREKFESVVRDSALIGFVNNDNKFQVYGLKDELVINTTIEELKEAWQKTLRW